MINSYDFKGSTWVELDHPTDDEIRDIAERYGIDARVARDLHAPSLKQRVEAYGHYLYLILHFPAIRHSHGEDAVQELDFIIGKDFVITAKFDTIDSIHKFSKIIEAEAIIGRRELHERPEFIFFGILREIYKSLGDEIAVIEGKVEDIESKIYKGREREMVFALSSASRNLLDLKRTIEQHKEVLDDLERFGEKLFGTDFAHNVTVVRADYYKVRNLIRSNLELVHELRETNDSLLSTKQNEVMKLFTILAFVTFPLALIVDIFNIESDTTPLRHHPQGFWIVVSVMLISSAVMFGFFRYKKWL